MPRSIKETSITIGFVQVPVALYKAGQDGQLDLRSLCECGRPARQQIYCDNPTCGTALHGEEEVLVAAKGGAIVRVSDDGPYATMLYPSWQATPKRGYKYEDQYIELTQEEIKNAKGAVKYDTFDVQKTVEFKDVAMRYVLEDPVYLLPPSDSNQKGKQAYNLFVEALDQADTALLAYLTLRETAYRYAIVADRNKNILMAYKLTELRDLPYAPDKIAVTEKDRKDVQAILESRRDADPTLEAPKDAVLDLIMAKLDHVQKLEGIGEPIIVPK